MQNWDALQPTANYEQHNNWYNSMFATQIKTEPGTTTPPNDMATALHGGNHIVGGSPATTPPAAGATVMPTTNATASQLEHYLNMKQQQQHSAMDTMSALTPSPSNNDSMQHFFESNMQQQLLQQQHQHHQQQQQKQQQQYQQQFQAAQQAAAQNQISSAPHLPLGFNPLTPPGLPTAALPSMSHFYQHTTNLRHSQQTPSPSPLSSSAAAEHAEKLPAALTPRNTPPMDITPPKSPKPMTTTNVLQHTDALHMEKDQDLISNSSEDMKYMAESEDDESIRMPIYNSHGKMKNYKCKTCGIVAITKIAFWEHTRAHMKPEKILQCPKCPFVTELKHHLEYHIRKHKNLKPFQCDKCSYSCVNKSMLNSHRKSHSSVYQYRCSDCDYATKYCHSFKLHLRKYDHKPGMVLDEEGIPNPSVVIDVYGTRRGPKTKSASGGGSTTSKRSAAVVERLTSANLSQQCGDLKMTPTSQLSAALQGFPMPQHPMPASPAKSTTSSNNSELPALTVNMTLQKHQQQQQQQQKQQQQQQQQLLTKSNQQQQQQQMSNLLPPLASILQQNHNMAFFPYWNLNLQVLAAQQQAAVLAQLSPRMRETALQQLQGQQQQHQQHDAADSPESTNADDDDVQNIEDDDDSEHKSVDSAMDLSQGTPTKEERLTNAATLTAINMKLQEELNHHHQNNSDTPLISSTGSSRRKGRMLKLDTLLQTKSASVSPEQPKSPVAPTAVEMPTASSPIAGEEPIKLEVNSSADDEQLMETSAAAVAPTAITTINANATKAASSSSANTSASSTASSSGNSSNGSSSSTGNSPLTGGAIYECKYCDIYFKDAVLYTIHMGYHSCDDVFKCNMCGEKCDGPVGLFVHMARNAHS